MHRESKAELTDRLRREGRWEAFKERREQLKAAGKRSQGRLVHRRSGIPAKHRSAHWVSRRRQADNPMVCQSPPRIA
jgi:hypothetical protein